LAYALAWLSVAGGNSVMPPWVRHQFPQAGVLIKRLRDTACADPACKWCRERHNAKKELAHWFGFKEFRPEPADDDGRPLQQSIVEAAMRGEHVLAILPTGTGKSLCYQVPALSRFDKTGALTVVISPLVALMSDQVAGLEAKNIRSCAALNGLLSMPERADVLDRVRLGDIGILIVSPEQLRNRTLRKVLAQREIGAWVLDEAHCLSKWGQDFRPDYRYVSRFIREKQPGQPIPPVLCLTATAKPDVVADIVAISRTGSVSTCAVSMAAPPEPISISVSFRPARPRSIPTFIKSGGRSSGRRQRWRDRLLRDGSRPRRWLNF
jgi:ATP-dependent DNA helicase RecQ